MKEDDEAVTSLRMRVVDEEGGTQDIWTITESRVEEWRSGQVPIVTSQDFTVSAAKTYINLHLWKLQVQFLALRGLKDTGFVAIDDFEIFTEEEAEQCAHDPPEADPSPGTTTTTAAGSVKTCNFEEGTCGWDVQPPSAVFTWKRTNVGDLEAAGKEHPASDLDGTQEGDHYVPPSPPGHFMYAEPNQVPGGRTSLVSATAGVEETHCIIFSFYLASAGIQEMVVKTGAEGKEEYVWKVETTGKEWMIGQVGLQLPPPLPGGHQGQGHLRGGGGGGHGWLRCS